MNTVTVSTHRRPFHTRLCLESLCRAWRWHPAWAQRINVCLSATGHTLTAQEALGVIGRNPDVPFEVWQEPREVDNPHLASKWMLDAAFALDSDARMVLYVEDDVIVSPDAFLMLDHVQAIAESNIEIVATGEFVSPADRIAGACLYHETIPEHYIPNPPDPRRLHLYNGLNTCGGTAFLRKPYLEILSPSWNCKTVEPRGFDYSAHFLMYLHKLYMVYPDLSRSMNIGWSGGQLSQAQWAKYCGRSIWTQTRDARRDWKDFRLTGGYPEPVKETWMEAELQARGIGAAV